MVLFLQAVEQWKQLGQKAGSPPGEGGGVRGGEFTDGGGGVGGDGGGDVGLAGGADGGDKIKVRVYVKKKCKGRGEELEVEDGVKYISKK